MKGKKLIKGLIIGFILYMLTEIIFVILEAFELDFSEQNLPLFSIILIRILQLVGYYLILTRLFKIGRIYETINKAGKKLLTNFIFMLIICFLMFILMIEQENTFIEIIITVLLYLSSIWFYLGIYLLHKGLRQIAKSEEDSIWMKKACSNSWMLFVITSISSIFIDWFFDYTNRSKSTLTINWILNGLNVLAIIIMFSGLIRVLWHIMKSNEHLIQHFSYEAKLWSFKSLGKKSTILSFGLLFAIFIFGALAIFNRTDEYDFIYEEREIEAYNEERIYLTDYVGNRKKVKVPAEINGKKVVIGTDTFKKNTKIKKVIIEDGIEIIGEEAFFSCINLVEVTIPESVKEVSSKSFWGTPWLHKQDDEFIIVGDGILLLYNENKEEVKIPDNVKSIGHRAFGFLHYDYRGYDLIDSEIKKIILHKNITNIGDYAFTGLVELEEINLHNGITNIGYYAFAGCRKLKTIDLPSGISRIEPGTFSNCNSLEKILVPNSVNEIGYRAFNKCHKIEEINIPSGVKKIDFGTFSSCENLKEIKLPNGIEEIDNDAFYGCESLEEIFLPHGVTKIGSSAFDFCINLLEVYIPETVKNIGGNAFNRTPWINNNLEEFLIVGDDILIAYNENEQKPKELILPSGIRIIASETFDGYESLEKITIPEGVTEIGSLAFKDCSNLTTIDTPKTLREIGYNAFEGTSWFNNQGDYIIVGDGILYKYNGLEGSDVDLVIPDGIKEISSDAFAFLDNFNTITIPKGVKYFWWNDNHVKVNKFIILDPMTNLEIWKNKFDGVLAGYKGSETEKFAKKHGFKFESLD
ncbi:MAG: leucine-rich repeat domain-containing protein [bacterium]